MTSNGFPIVPNEAAQRTNTGRGRRPYRAVTGEDLAANIAVDTWARLIGLIADGVRSQDAIRAVGASRALVEGMLRTSKERRQEWDDARLARFRRDWDLDLIDQVCQQIAGGLSTKKACALVNRDATNFLVLVLNDPYTKERYDEARKVRAELWADETIDIADNDSHDIDLTGKGNIAAVKRADTRISARHKLMADFSRERFGEKDKSADVNINLNLNHAERLEAAHARRRAAVKREGDVIEAEVVEKKPTTMADLAAKHAPSRGSNAADGAQSSARAVAKEDWLS